MFLPSQDRVNRHREKHPTINNLELKPQMFWDRQKFRTGIREVTSAPVAKHKVTKPYRGVQKRRVILDIRVRSTKTFPEIFYPLQEDISEANIRRKFLDNRTDDEERN